MKPWQVPQESCCSIYLVDLKWIFLLRLLKISYSQVISVCVTKCWICCLVVSRATYMLVKNGCRWLYVGDNSLLFVMQFRYWWHFCAERKATKTVSNIVSNVDVALFANLYPKFLSCFTHDIETKTLKTKFFGFNIL